MHHLIVTAHPDPQSLTHAIVTRLAAAIGTAEGNTVETVDLIAEGFDPRFTAADHEVFQGRAEHGPAIRAEQQRLDRADALVLVFPVYWWSIPAILKGWIDRVFTAGWAFEEDPAKGIVPLLGRLKGQVVAVAGADRRTYDRRGYLDALTTQIAEGVFGFCGMETIGIDLVHSGDPDQARHALARVSAIVQRLAGEGA